MKNKYYFYFLIIFIVIFYVLKIIFPKEDEVYEIIETLEKTNLESYKKLFDKKEYAKMTKNEVISLREAIENKNEEFKKLFKFVTCEYFTNGNEENKHIGFWILIYLHRLTNLEFSLIPGGQFFMGSPESEEGRPFLESPLHCEPESPLHKVKVNPFLLCRTEVTQKAWKKIMKNNPSYPGDNTFGEKYPVNCIKWKECNEFCKKIGLNMPSEAQWEYACRAGSDTRFFWGEDIKEINIFDYAWFKKNSENKIHIVAKKLPNAFGLFDIIGNCEEYCQDLWHSDYVCAPSDDKPWDMFDSNYKFRNILPGYYKKEDMIERVCRGGSVYSSITKCRSAYRKLYLSFDSNYDLSFRCCYNFLFPINE